MNNINVMQITGEFLSVEDIEKRFAAQSARIAELELANKNANAAIGDIANECAGYVKQLTPALAQCAEKHKSLQLCDELLDEIDTASDMFKPDLNNPYVKSVIKSCTFMDRPWRQALSSNAGQDFLDKLAALTSERDGLEVEYKSRAVWIQQMNDLIGYNNNDGFHSEPDPFAIVTGMKAKVAKQEKALELWMQSVNEDSIWLSEQRQSNGDWTDTGFKSQAIRATQGPKTGEQ